MAATNNGTGGWNPMSQMGANIMGENYQNSINVPIGQQLMNGAAMGYGGMMGGALSQLGAGLQNAGAATSQNWGQEVGAGGQNLSSGMLNPTLFSDPKMQNWIRQDQNAMQRGGMIGNQLLSGKINAVSPLLRQLTSGMSSYGGASGGAFGLGNGYTSSNGSSVNPFALTSVSVPQQSIARTSVPRTSQTNYYGPTSW